MLFPTKSKILETHEDKNWQTTIVVEFGKNRLKFFAIELFRIGNDSLFSQVSREANSKFSFKRKILTKSDKFLSIISTPTIFGSNIEELLINQLIVKTEDNTIFKVEAFIDLDGYQNKDQYIELTEKVFNSLIMGKRINNKKARVEYHQVFWTKKYFKFKLPENYFVTTDDHFMEFMVHKYYNYNDSNWSVISVATPNLPRYECADWGFDTRNAIETKGNFIGKKITWYFYEDKLEKKYYKESQENFEKIDKIDDTVVEIVIFSNNSKDINELTKIVERIKLKRKLWTKPYIPSGQ